MSHGERTGVRNLLYSGWHRRDSIKRFFDSVVTASKVTMVDIDSCEACCYCSAPLALIETEMTQRTTPKKAPITAALAQLAKIPAYSVAYWSADGVDIERFIVRRIQPSDDWNQLMSPAEYAEFLVALRSGHDCASED